jgi:hypothetical protein
MIRRVVAQQHQAAQIGGGQEVDTFVDRVVKYIPAEIVSAWVAAKGVVEAAGAAANAYVLWVCFAVGVILTALYTLKKTAVPGLKPAYVQTGIATVAFVVWVIALGEPFATLFGKAQQSLYGSLLLIAYTVGVALLVKNPDPPTPT